MSGEHDAVQKKIGDAYDAGYRRGLKAGVKLAQQFASETLQPLTPEQQANWDEAAVLFLAKPSTEAVMKAGRG